MEDSANGANGSSQPKRAWATLLTKTSYLAGAVMLGHSLHKHNSKYPLVILYTPSFPAALLPELQREGRLTNCVYQPIEPLVPKQKVSLIAARFEDTWTKLRVFELVEYERMVFLDADMLVFRNMDELFDMSLPSDWIAANHSCVCNLDKDSWAPKDWVKENCAYTPLKHPSCLQETAPVPKDETQGKRTHLLLNGGLFIFTPFKEQWESMMRFFETTPLLKEWMFPDQDFLAEYFKGRWKSVGYQYNAIKTMRYWHPEMWRDEEIRNLHYIVDKPWSKRVGPDGIAGYLGRDGETHTWWWNEYGRWEEEREKAEENEILALIREHVAKPYQEGKEQDDIHGNWKANPSEEQKS